MALSVFIFGFISAAFVIMLSEIHKIRISYSRRQKINAIELNNSFKTQQTTFNAGYGVIEPLKLSHKQVKFYIRYTKFIYFFSSYCVKYYLPFLGLFVQLQL